MSKLFECYVASPTHDEAVEIVERLVANGAEANDVVDGMDVSFSGDECAHNEYSCWGYNSWFGTYTNNSGGDWAKRSKRLTMKEFRAAFPCDKYDGVVEKRFPSIGTKCESSGGAEMFYVGLSSSGEYVFELNNGGLTTFDTLEGMRPAKSDREKFIEAATRVANSVPNDARLCDIQTMMGKLYDADFKAPEAK